MPAVLIVEDDPALSGLLQQVLQDEGYHTCTATSLAEARSALEREPFDLVLADLIEFNLRSGPGALDALRALAGGRPLVLCTGQPDGPRLGAAAGLTAILVKPFDLDHLVEVVRTALASAPPRPD